MAEVPRTSLIQETYKTEIMNIQLADAKFDNGREGED